MFERQYLFVSRNIPARQVGGVATEGGIEATARTARNLGYEVVVLRDCVGSRSRDLHDLAVKLMEQTHFNVVTGKEIADIWDNK
jgi:nicotinamidase-related amidase